MEKTYRALLRDVAQIVVGELVSETDATVTLRNSSILGITIQAETNMNLQFIPMNLVCINPAVSLTAILAPGEHDDVITFRKDLLLSDNVNLNKQIFDGYISSRNPAPTISTPQHSGAIVGPNGQPIASTPPVVHDLFG